ncbi:precorrin-4 C(11)-methyltransferase [Tsukamurella sp. 8F]|uniref:precorrin-4 C(11)-methyltransferase n=1 Tax=unclassified Tsukamurella TaxID=2633480 RepID=UPI0023BA1800|nr:MULTISPECIES: precorrin-4 C(11)-methyltransferase [unclassified Tsukamurella]MDF0530563.1 precorrin-4 C(11)-methyltransferase [Tsukamurella sp. 8J]MDF0586787.1 precorrin-4 C(11)-methyltransferase [Tsukamurella sp. 8F]
MTVYFIGAGPGAPDLLTLRGADTLARCAVCLYAGSLVPGEMLERCPDGAELIDTARMPLEDIISRIEVAHLSGLDVARLHSGDVSLYSAFAEQARRLDALGVPYEVVPGVPAFAAAAASLGRELTVPEVGQSLLITRVSTLSTDMPPGEDLASLARTGVTLALHLAAHRAEALTNDLAPHYGVDCPVAVVAFASRPDERVVRCRLGDLPEQLAAEGITRTAVIFVGRVLDAEQFPDSYLYSAARTRGATH